MPTSRSTPPTSTRRCACCVPAAWWPSTTPSGTTGSPTPPSGTRRLPPSVSSAAPWPTTSRSCRSCCPSATACSWRRRSGCQRLTSGPRERVLVARGGQEALAALGHGHHVAGLDQDRRGADDLRARRLRGGGLEGGLELGAGVVGGEHVAALEPLPRAAAPGLEAQA